MQKIALSYLLGQVQVLVDCYVILIIIIIVLLQRIRDKFDFLLKGRGGRGIETNERI